ncbi:unnamed protein product [Arctia plantaginis]|uniref:Hemolin n=1 Tax=Arctia plantaginis TaxID=874455 RepID=A0A8S1A5I4_ARCPL|nr:unnamed protein product [Arctia plantaginis]
MKSIPAISSIDLPRFVGSGSNVTVAVGRDAALTCRVDNLQTFKVAWLRVDTQTILTIAGHVITKNHRVSVGHGDGAWTLGLKEIGPLDGGRYMCQVNTEPMMSQTHLLHVVVPPDIDDDVSSSEVLVNESDNAALRCVASGTPPPNIAWRREDSRHFKIDNQTLVSPSVWAGRVAIRAPSGGSITLQCTAEAYPVPQYYWTLNGEQRIVNGTKHRLSITTRGYRHTLNLMVTDMSREDAGAYRCHVENTQGRAQAELFLHNDPERHLEQLHRGVLEDSALDNPYIVLSQHQMQNLEMVTTM